MQVGIGAFVLNDEQEVLVVQERRGPLRGKVRLRLILSARILHIC